MPHALTNFRCARNATLRPHRIGVSRPQLTLVLMKDQARGIGTCAPKKADIHYCLSKVQHPNGMVRATPNLGDVLTSVPPITDYIPGQVTYT